MNVPADEESEESRRQLASFAEHGGVPVAADKTQEERQLSLSINSYALLTGARGSAAHLAFEQQHKTLTDAIAGEIDIAKKSGLRDARLAIGYAYAAELMTRLADSEDDDGRSDEADQLRVLAESYRETSDHLAGKENPPAAD